jgi:hypothetical protein
MDRTLSRRMALRSAATALFITTAIAVLGSGTALAATAPSPSPKPGTPNGVKIEGEGLSSPLILTAADQPDEFDAVYSEVVWMTSRPSISTAPSPSLLGPRYTINVLADGTPTQTYYLYPLAAGGARAYRPDKQPGNKKVTAAWLYGHVNMPSTLRAAGVPIPGVSMPPGGGKGGGAEAGDRQDIGEMFGEWRGVVALNGFLVLLIAFGLFGIAFRIRRKI